MKSSEVGTQFSLLGIPAHEFGELDVGVLNHGLDVFGDLGQGLFGDLCFLTEPSDVAQPAEVFDLGQQPFALRVPFRPGCLEPGGRGDPIGVPALELAKLLSEPIEFRLERPRLSASRRFRRRDRVPVVGCLLNSGHNRGYGILGDASPHSGVMHVECQSSGLSI